ncbi:protein-L-isoaspartate O-methyltransferase [Amphibiibacter pelophylacis]|uniref:Protein-L-isoaspartate O-methyltransferase n=1 Tax=Amphibiibacter pelophylacis TaxID=1799477 RepID=A0ACC6P5P5_9BURK
MIHRPARPGATSSAQPSGASDWTALERLRPGERVARHLTAAPDSPTSPAALRRPQLHLAQAAHEAGQPLSATGLGVDSQRVRDRMVQRLQQQGLTQPQVMDAMSQVPRHLYVDSALALQSYEDTSLPIGHGQTISKPSVVARMLEVACQGDAARERLRQGQRPLGRVLEIGAGCGYVSSLLGLLADSVVAIERIAPLHARARQQVQAWLATPQARALRAVSPRLIHGDGRLPVAGAAPFDTVLAAACGDDVPDAWLTQLAPGGVVVTPWHDASRGGQVLLVLRQTPRGVVREVHEAVCFVPLKSGLVL